MKNILTSFLLISLSCQAQTDTSNEDGFDRYGPYSVYKSTPAGIWQIGGVSSFAGDLGLKDTLQYWLTVIDTASGVKVVSKALGLDYNIGFIIKGYGLWVGQDINFGPHWELYDIRFRRIRDLPLFVTRIIEIPTIRRANAYGYRKSEDTGKSEITVENVPVGIEIETYNVP